MIAEPNIDQPAYRGRLAPTPSGDIHLGNARTALLAWLAARARGGAVVLRVEDLDEDRVAPGAEARICEDFTRLGLDWDEGPGCGGPHRPYRQSERRAAYDEAIDVLLRTGRAFPCACSRADVARAATAPHPGEEGPRYPGTCRDLPVEVVIDRARAQGRAPVIRARGGPFAQGFADEVHGHVDGPAGGVDDFVIRRADGTAAYQLAVVVDDAAMKISQVVRGDDLLSSTHRQLLLYRALGYAAPTFAHVPLVLAPGGERLAKRTRPLSVRALLDAGVAAERIVGALAASAGLCLPGTSIRPHDLIGRFAFDLLPRAPVEMDGHVLLTS